MRVCVSDILSVLFVLLHVESDDSDNKASSSKKKKKNTCTLVWEVSEMATVCTHHQLVLQWYVV